MSSIRRFFSTTVLWLLLLPYAITGLGAASNQLVLIANHDRFPVLVSAWKVDHMDTQTASDGTVMIDPVHCVMSKTTHLNLMADIFDLHDGIYSIGDFFVMFGEWLQAFCPFVWVALVCERLRRP